MEPVCNGLLGTNQKCPGYLGVVIFRSFYITKCYLRPQLSVWINQPAVNNHWWSIGGVMLTDFLYKGDQSRSKLWHSMIRPTGEIEMSHL